MAEAKALLLLLNCFPFDPSAHCSQDPVVVIGFNTNSVCPLAALRLLRDLPRFVFYESHMSFELDRAYSTMDALTMLESDSTYSQCHRCVNLAASDQPPMLFKCLECNQFCRMPTRVTCALFHLSGPKANMKSHHAQACEHLRVFKPRLDHQSLRSAAVRACSGSCEFSCL